jgi:hypothetical protein
MSASHCDTQWKAHRPVGTSPVQQLPVVSFCRDIRQNSISCPQSRVWLNCVWKHVNRSTGSLAIREDGRCVWKSIENIIYFFILLNSSSVNGVSIQGLDSRKSLLRKCCCFLFGRHRSHISLRLPVIVLRIFTAFRHSLRKNVVAYGDHVLPSVRLKRLSDFHEV